MTALPGPARLRELLRYVPETGEFFWRVSRIRRAAFRAGRLHPSGYIHIGIDGERHFAHRIAWSMMAGFPPDHEIDHRDGNRSNNAWSNLRAATAMQNSHNRKPRENTRAGLKGVTARKHGYVATIWVDRRRINLGFFKDPALAHAAYAAAAHEFFGEFARTESG